MDYQINAYKPKHKDFYRVTLYAYLLKKLLRK